MSILRRMFLNAKSEDAEQLVPVELFEHVSSSAASIPVANAPPMSPPMLVPAATSIGMRCSSNQRMTPMCAMPRALPPPNATPIVGRWPSAASAA